MTGPDTPTPPAAQPANAQSGNDVPRIGVVVVTYNSGEVIASCLDALCARRLPTVVVDNASSDDTCHIARGYPVELVENPSNQGFAAAVNQGFQALSTPLVLLLNPDVCLEGDLNPLVSALADPKLAAVCGTLLDPERKPQHGFQLRRFPTPITLLLENLGINRLFPGNRVNQKYRYAGADWSRDTGVEQPAGAFLLIRRSAWQHLEGFDERFFPLWFEDVDFCLRLRQSGFGIRYVATVVGIHQGGHSIRRLEPGIRQLYWYRSLLEYSAKHFSSFWFRLIALSVLAAVPARVIAMARINKVLGNRGTLSRVTRMALRAIFTGRLPSSEIASR
jgi:N-acetylglucosaminyl-diphospho-decaprenol L-rhamnosyltransferase